jgi:hypothetical protein
VGYERALFKMPLYTPPPARIYLLSRMAREYAASGSTFLQRYSGSWLVWEPGAWRPSRVHDLTQLSVDGEPAPAMTDAVTFHLQDRRAMKIGRSSSCDIVINDATVSREHLSLEPDGDGWKVKVLSSRSPTELAGTPSIAGQELPLTSGARLGLGGVSLTFWDTEGLAQRLPRL